jgi:hypothetical protein
MAHVIGIGTVWDITGLAGSRTRKCPYYGRNANLEYKKLTGCSSVPLELDGDAEGTQCSHFDDECLQNELMTGFLNYATSYNPLSRITIGALRDLGYTDADYSKADKYERSDINPSCYCTRRQLQDGNVEMTQSNQTYYDTQRRSTKRSSGSGRKLPKNRRRRRRLSDEGRFHAKKYGISILRQNAKENSHVSSLSPNIEYIGDKYLTVLYLENDHIYDVHVSSDDLIDV